MSLVDQFIASLGFQFSKIASFRSQSFWKSLFYLVILILLSGSIIAAMKLSKSESIAKQIHNLPDSYMINKSGASSLNEKWAIQLPQIDTVIVLGETSSLAGIQGFKNLICLGKEGWSIGRVGFPTKKLNYEKFPFQKDNEELTKKELMHISKDLDQTIKTFAPIYLYVQLFLDLLIHFVLVSILAIAGSSFKKLLPITYKEVWNITCYGITAPIVVRTLFDLLGFSIPLLTTIYWIAVALFSILSIRHIQTSEETVNQAS